MSLTYPEAQAREALIHDVHTQVQLDFTDPDRAVVQTLIRFACREAGASTFVEIAGATSVHAVGWAPLRADAESTPGRIELTNLAGPGQVNEVEVAAFFDYGTDGDGITQVIDAADGERYVCTYTAMDIAQRVFPCFDQPDLKSTFTVSVTVPEHWTVLANGPVTGRQDNTWFFAETPPISTYLFFVAAGPWTSRIWEHAGMPFGWHARASQSDALDREIAWLQSVTMAAFDWYTDAFDEPYPFADYHQVFSPGLNWGAMEFPGCVAFRDEYLTPGEPTAIQRQALSSVVCHEMAHMWFGDLVTMKWWQDTWLNESFADFMGYRVSGLTGHSTGWTMATLVRKPTAYRADARRSTHRIAEDAENLVDVDTAFANFDMITYAKGNAVLHQLVTWLGTEDFMAGVNAHLSAHRFGNATLADFLDALDGATDRDVRAWAEAWLRTTGYDRIVLDLVDGVPTLRREGSRPHRFTVTGFDGAGAVARQQVVDLADQPVPLPAFASLAVLPNSENEAYAELVLPEESWRPLVELTARMESAQHRAMIWATAAERVRSGADPVATLVRDAARLLALEDDPTVFEGSVGLVHDLVTSHAHPAEVAALLEELAELARQVTSAGPATHAGAAARLLAATSSNVEVLTQWLAADQGLLADDQQLRWKVVTRLVELGRSEVIEQEELRDPTTAGRHAAQLARAAVPTREAKQAAWAVLTSGTLSNREFTSVAAGFWRVGQSDLVAPWITAAPAALAELAARSGQAMGQLIGRALPVIPLARATAEDLADAIEAALESESTPVPTVTARQFNDRLDDLRLTLAATHRRH